MTAPALFWFRRDLRLNDNPGLAAAIASARPLLAVFVEDSCEAGTAADGAAARWWLHHSLESLQADLTRIGGTLLILRGAASQIIPELAARIGAAAVYCNRRDEPWAMAQQAAVTQALRGDGRALVAGNAGLLFEPGDIVTGAGQPFRVFTPFWRACLSQPPPPLPIDAPGHWPASAEAPTGLTVADLNLLPRAPDWAGGLRETWQPGEAAAQSRLDQFIDTALGRYASERDLPGRASTSALSPHLHFGEISPRQIFHAVRQRCAPCHDADKFLAELGWREFSYHLLGQFPRLDALPMRDEFSRMPWRDDPVGLAAWQRGATGFPIVDAGMRQLWHTGWMHNRVRMVVASFLVKNLLIPWQVGATWFWDTLVDADLASNSASWQWVAGCGADAAPFFRIFNPLLQGEKFDPAGDYVRRWCPELRHLPDRLLHRPWEADRTELKRAGLTLGETYPQPILDLAASRDRALAALQSLKAS